MSARSLTCLLLAVASLVAGCGGHEASNRSAGTSTSATGTRTSATGTRSATTDARAPSGPDSIAPGHVLIYFKRVQGGDPMASQLTVDKNGSAAAYVTLGGINGEKKHEWQMTPAQLRRLRTLIRHTRMRNGPCCDVRFYVYWIYIDGHAWRLAQGRVPPPLRPLINTLDSITDAHTYY